MPPVRSRSMATLVTRNIIVNGKIPSSNSAMRSNSLLDSYIWLISASSRPGTTSSSATVRRSPRNWASTRSAVAPMICTDMRDHRVRSA